MKARRLVAVWSLLPIISMVGCYYNSGITTEKIDALIKQEVPANADKAQVLAFLDAHAITHTDVAEFPKGYLEEPELDSDLSSDKLKGKVGRVRKYAVANIPTTKIRPLVTYNLIIKFYFDKDDRLVEYLVRSVGTGF